MSEIRDKLKEEIAQDIIGFLHDIGVNDKDFPATLLAEDILDREQIHLALTLLEKGYNAKVDRDAELLELVYISEKNKENELECARHAQVDMLKEGWVKEIQ